MKQTGSALIVILLSMSIILVACAALFRSSVFFKSLAATRLKEAQAELFLMGLMQYGIALTKDNYGLLTDEKFSNETVTIALNLPEDGSGQIVLHPKKKAVDIQVSAQSKASPTRSAACTLSLREQDKKLLISGFQTEHFAL